MSEQLSRYNIDEGRNKVLWTLWACGSHIEIPPALSGPGIKAGTATYTTRRFLEMNNDNQNSMSQRCPTSRET